MSSGRLGLESIDFGLLLDGLISVDLLSPKSLSSLVINCNQVLLLLRRHIVFVFINLIDMLTRYLMVVLNLVHNRLIFLVFLAILILVLNTINIYNSILNIYFLLHCIILNFVVNIGLNISLNSHRFFN